MSAVSGRVDLTLYGCPMHYIKAREAIRKIETGQALDLIVNNGDAVDEVLRSLRQDGQQCEIITTDQLTTTMRVTKEK